MAVTNTRATIRQTLLKREPSLGWADTMDSSPAGNTYVDQDYRFAIGTYGPTRFKDYFVYIPGTSVANDVLRRGTTLDPSTGRLSITGAAYNASTTQTAYELWAIDPTEVNQHIQLAQQQVRQQLLLPLSGGRISGGVGGPHDFDMEADATAVYWGATVALGGSAVSNITPTKTTTDVLNNTRALLLTATGSSGTCRGEKLRCKEGDTFYSAVIARADVGTFGFTWYNTTGAAIFSNQAAYTYTGEDFVIIWRKDTVPSGCEEMQPQFSLTGASDIAIVDTLFGPVFNGQRNFALPTTINDTFEVKAISPQRYQGFSTSSSNLLDVYTQEAMGDWQQPLDFRVQAFRRDAVGTRLITYKDLPQVPTWVSLERDLYKAGETLGTESATSSGDLDEIAAYTFVNIATAQLTRNPGDGSMAALLAKYGRKVAQEEIARPPLAVVPQRHHIVPVA